jgi:pyruvate dehydrogenase E1 component alpha subunit
VKVDGNDVLAVHTQAALLVQQVRAGSGPRLLHAITYRVKGHVSVDLAAYRNPEELQAALQTDPILRAREQYLALRGSDAQLFDIIEREASEEVAAALAAADAAPWPEAVTAFTDVQTTGAGQWH